MKVTIIGAGISGLTLAYFLKQLGAEVEVFDQDTLAMGATGKAAGLVTLQLNNTVDIKAVQNSLQFFKFVTEKSNGIFKFKKTGMARLGRSDKSCEFIENTQSLYETLDIPVKLYKNSIETLDLQLKNVRLLSFCEEDGYVDPYALSYALYSYFRASDVHINLLEAVKDIKLTDNRVTGIICGDGEVHKTDIVVLSTGVWTPFLLRKWLSLPLPIKPYSAKATAMFTSFEIPVAVYDLDSGVYIVPEVRGSYIVGDGTEVGEYNPFEYQSGADFDFYHEISSAIFQFLPSLIETSSLGKGWSGLLAGTPDRFPILGNYPGIEGLYIAAGFNGYGIMRAPGMMEWLAKNIMDGTPLPNEVSIERFSSLDVEFQPSPGFPPLKNSDNRGVQSGD